MPFPENITPNNYPNTSDVNSAQIVENASNVASGDNPDYTSANFFTLYPQFNNTSVVPTAVLNMYIGLAKEVVNVDRFQEMWEHAMGLFIAHFLTLWLQGTAAANSPAAKVLSAGSARGLRTSSSVGDVSVSYDFQTIAQGINGWASWKLTTYGIQFATIGRIAGKGGMGIY